MAVIVKANLDGSAAIQTAGVDRIKINADGGVQCNEPAFAYVKSAAQTVPATAATVILYDLKEFDTTNAYNPANGRFTPLVAGYYQFNASVNLPAASSIYTFDIHKNGVPVRRGSQENGNSATARQAAVSSLIYLNGSTDYIDVRLYSDTAQTLSTTSYLTVISGFLARAA